MTNAEKLIEGLVGFGINSNSDAIVMVATKPTMPFLVLKQALIMSMGSPVLVTTLSTENGRVVYTARDTDTKSFGIATNAFSTFNYEASKNDQAESAKLTNDLVDVFGYLEETEVDPYMAK